MRPYSRYTSHHSTTDTVTFDTTDAQIVRPYNRYSSVRSYFSLHVGAVETIADHSVTLSAPELRLSVLMNCRITFAPSTYFSEALPPILATLLWL